MSRNHLVRTGHKIYAHIFYYPSWYEVRIHRSMGTWEVGSPVSFDIPAKPGAAKMVKALCDLLKDKTDEEIYKYCKAKFPPSVDGPGRY